MTNKLADAVAAAEAAARLHALVDPLVKARELVDPPHLREMRRMQELIGPANAVAAVVEEQERIKRLTGGVAEHFRSPVRDALDALARVPATGRIAHTFPPAPAEAARPRPSLPASRDNGHEVHSVSDIGRQVREARKAMGMTQQRFADVAGVGRRFVIELEQGKPTVELGRVLKVCAAAGIRLRIG